MVLQAAVPYTSDIEEVRSDEQDTVTGWNETFDTNLETTAKDHGHSVRSMHAKSHGVLKGVMTVGADLPPVLTQGPFARPGEHKIYMRMSTNAGDVLPDVIGLPRGLTIKVLDVEGDRMPEAEGLTQDFVMVNGNVFQAKNADKFLGNLKILAKTTCKMEGTKKVVAADPLTCRGVRLPAKMAADERESR